MTDLLLVQAGAIGHDCRVMKQSLGLILLTVVGGNLSPAVTCLPTPCTLNESSNVALVWPWNSPAEHRAPGTCTRIVSRCRASRPVGRLPLRHTPLLSQRIFQVLKLPRAGARSLHMFAGFYGCLTMVALLTREPHKLACLIFSK